MILDRSKITFPRSNYYCYKSTHAASALRYPQQVTALKFVDYPPETSVANLNQYTVDVIRNNQLEEQRERKLDQSITPC
jgi:hypothetical protein